MKDLSQYIIQVFNSNSLELVSINLERALADLKTNGFFEDMPDFYQTISLRNPNHIEKWFEELKRHNDDEIFPEGNLKELFGLVNAGLDRIRELGFVRS